MQARFKPLSCLFYVRLDQPSRAVQRPLASPQDEVQLPLHLTHFNKENNVTYTDQENGPKSIAGVAGTRASQEATYIVCTVSCACDTVPGVPATLCLTVTPALKSRMHELSALVRAQGVYEISEFNYESTWCTGHFDPICTDAEAALTKVDSLLTRPVSVDAPMLHVMADRFWFSAYPHHGGDSELLSTPHIRLEMLSSKQLVVVVEYKYEASDL